MPLNPTGLKNKFVVKTAGAGTGLLCVMCDGPSKAALSCKEVEEGYEFSYTPFCPGDYLITVKYGNIPIAGSPHLTNVTGKLLLHLYKHACGCVSVIKLQGKQRTTKHCF